MDVVEGVSGGVGKGEGVGKCEGEGVGKCEGKVKGEGVRVRRRRGVWWSGALVGAGHRI